MSNDQIAPNNFHAPNVLPVENILQIMSSRMQPFLKLDPLLVAIQTGGVWVAEQLHRTLQMEEPLGTVDISFYRDDFSKIGTHPQVHGSYLPIEIDDRHIIIIDDVLHTGRTARAALNELFAWGRPASVVLAVLLDRGNREVPLHAEIVGHHMSLENDDFVKISADGQLYYSNFSSN